MHTRNNQILASKIYQTEHRESLRNNVETRNRVSYHFNSSLWWNNFNKVALTVFKGLQCHSLVPLCKGIVGSLGFWIPHLGFRIPGTGFQSFSVELGFWIPIINGNLDSLKCILDSKAQDSKFHKQNFPCFPNSTVKNFPNSRILTALQSAFVCFFHII